MMMLYLATSLVPGALKADNTLFMALLIMIHASRDIAIGNAFKDYPVLFLILDKCSSAVQHPVDDTLRSVLVYFFAFWHMSQVAQAPTALKFATQLEETIRLIMLLEQVLYVIDV